MVPADVVGAGVPTDGVAAGDFASFSGGTLYAGGIGGNTIWPAGAGVGVTGIDEVEVPATPGDLDVLAEVEAEGDGAIEPEAVAGAVVGVEPVAPDTPIVPGAVPAGSAAAAFFSFAAFDAGPGGLPFFPLCSVRCGFCILSSSALLGSWPMGCIEIVALTRSASRE